MPSPTERLSTAVADRYRIERHLGEGGMATVYLAHDLKHDRKVALKVLRPELAAVIGAERFLAEIKTTANLQHPNILPLFDSGDADGQLFYVMPYTEGETLRDRITREKQLPVDDVVRLGAEVASALDYAHRQGVIHRDIKPENILLHDGRALVADFGIALAVSTAGANRMTETGMSVGTPAYMSPEQAMGGHDVTARSDVYALGATLYEALVGEPPFTGPTAQAIIARLVTEDPRPLASQRKTVPPHVEAAVLTALQRLPADRFATAADFGEALEGRGGVTTRVVRGAPATDAQRDAGFRVSRPVGAVAAAGFLALAAAALWGWLRPQPALPLSRETVVLGPSGVPGSIGAAAAVAPDGSAIVYGDTVGGLKLWIKERGELNSRVLAAMTDKSGGTAPGPSFSPDGHWILYSDGPLKRVARDGGAPVIVSDSASNGGGAWLDDGTIVFPGRNGDRLFRTTADGGATTRVLTTDSAGGLINRVAPVPGANAVLVSIAAAVPRVIAFDLSTHSIHEIARNALAAWVVPGGDIAYVQTNGSLFAARFDARKLEAEGAPVSVLDSVRVAGASPDIAMGADGTMFYAQGAAAVAGTSLELVALSRDGSREHRVDSTWSAPIAVNGGLALSPDGSRVALSVADTTGNRADITVLRLPDGPATRLTFAGTQNIRPAWSSDGKTILYTSDASSTSGKMELWARHADGSGRPVRVVSEARGVWEGLWSPDGKWLVYRTDDVAAGSGDILAVRTGGDTTPVPLVATPAEETGPALSPDGRWLAYASNVTGRKEVYVVPFPDAQDGHWQVSTDGGSEALWSHDGKELFYRNASGQAIAVDVSGTPTFTAGAHQVLFNARDYAANDDSHYWAVTPDSRTFLMLRPVASGQGVAVTAGRTILVRNWLPELKAKLKG